MRNVDLGGRMDWYREINARLASTQAQSADARRAVFDALRAKAPASERDRLEVAIRRIEQHALIDAPPVSTPIVPTDGVSDHVYEMIKFSTDGTDALRRGVVGWSEGPQCHVTLQVWDGPQGEGRGPYLGRAVAKARKRLARSGFTPLNLPRILTEAEARLSSRPGLFRSLRALLGGNHS